MEQIEDPDFFLQLVQDNREKLLPLAQWGNGRCGWMAWVMAEELIGPYVPLEPLPRKKAVIPAVLRTAVFERDEYRCKWPGCGTHLSLTCDHVVPESKGGPTTLENLQTLCRSHNSTKGTKTP